MRLILAAGAACVFLLATGCTQSVQPVEDPVAVEAVASGVAVTLVVKRDPTVAYEGDCYLTLRDLDSGDYVELAAPYGRRDYIVPLAPGVWVPRLLYCGRGRTWHLGYDALATWRVAPGVLTYGGIAYLHVRSTGAPTVRFEAEDAAGRAALQRLAGKRPLADQAAK